MSSCPGYLGITINDRLEQEELFRYDTLISCPTEFNVTFKVPNWGVKQDKTFDVVLDDAKTQYKVYLTHLHFEDYAGHHTPSARKVGNKDMNATIGLCIYTGMPIDRYQNQFKEILKQ